MSADLLFEIRHAPADDRDRLETLEPVLAAAALEFDIDVLFLGPGAGHLHGPGSERWDQLEDFGLGRLWVDRAAAQAENGRSAGRLDADAIEQLRCKARRLVGL